MSMTALDVGDVSTTATPPPPPAVSTVAGRSDSPSGGVAGAACINSAGDTVDDAVTAADATTPGVGTCVSCLCASHAANSSSTSDDEAFDTASPNTF